MSVRRLTLALGAAALVAPLGGGAMQGRVGVPLPIVFSSAGRDDPDSRQVEAISADGSARQRLTVHAPSGSLRGWTPQGTRVVFETSARTLWTVDGRGKDAAPAGPSLYPGMSPSRRLIAFWTSAGNIAIVRRGERGQRVIRTRVNFETQDVGDAPWWSPDNRYLAYSVYSETTDSSRVFVVPLDSLVPRSVSVGARPEDFDPEWSPRAATLAFRGGRRGSDLVVYSPDTRSRRTVARHAGDFEWSPTGTTIAYLAAKGGVYLVRERGGPVHRIARTSPKATITWGPRGKALAYGDNGLLYVVHLPTRRTTLLPPVGGSNPRWWPGRRIAFDAGDEIYTIAATGADLRRVTHVVSDTSPQWSPDGTKIAFVRSSSSGDAIVVMAAGGGALRVLAHGRDPSWSPDSRRIAFTVPDDVGTGSWIETVAVDGSGLRRVTSGTAPAWSPRGDAIAFLLSTGHAANALRLVAPDGSNERTLLQRSFFGPNELGAEDSYTHPAWSPDARRIAVVAELEDPDPTGGGIVDAVVGVVEVGTRQTSTLAHEDAQSLVWSPDGTAVAATGLRHASIGLLAADGSGEITLVPSQRDFDYGAPTWSPDGRRLAYSRCSVETDECDLFVVNRNGANRHRLTRGGADTSPAWQPRP